MERSAVAPPRKRALSTIFLTILLDLIGFGMILPLLPFYAQRFGARDVEIGLLFAAYSLAQLVFAPILGRASDRLGRRPLLLASIAGSVVAYSLFALAESFGVLLFARALAGVAAANYGIAQAYVADVTTEEDRSRGMGLVGAAFGLGFIVGPALGGLLAHFGERAVPLGAAALAVVNLLLALAWLPESLSTELAGRSRERPWLDLEAVRGLARNLPLLGLLLLFFTVMLCFSMMEATLALFCQDRFGFGTIETSWLFVYVGVLLVAVQGGLIGRLTRRFGERRLVLAGILLMAVGLLLLPQMPAVWLFGGALALLAVGSGIHNPAISGLLSRVTDAGAQGSIIGLSRSCGALARTLGPPAGTALFAGVGTAWPFWAAGGLMALSLLFAAGVLRRLP